MKKLICALLGLFISVSAFAGGDADIVAQTTLRIQFHWPDVKSVIMADSEMAKYLSDMERVFKEKYNASEDHKMTTSDMMDVCAAGRRGDDKVTNAFCYEHLVLPVLNIMKAVMFANACGTAEKVYGYHAKCKAGVFSNTYTLSKKVYISNEEYHQNVDVPEYTAYGLAIEYIRTHSFDGEQASTISCSPTINDNWINCTAWHDDNERNDEFYSFHFAGTSNSADSTVEENTIRGICALNEVPYRENDCSKLNTANRVHEWDCRPGCDMNCASGYKRGKKRAEQIERFGLKASDGANSPISYVGDVIVSQTDAEVFCKIWRPNEYGGDNKLRTYPEHEDMSMAFAQVQAVYDRSLIEVLKTYVQTQGIEVSDFSCNWGTSSYSDTFVDYMGSAVAGDGADDIATCRINGHLVDFVFDDLMESKDYAKQAGLAGMSCLTAPAALAKVLNEKFTTKFDGKSCIGPGKKICNAMNDFVPGGTKWDADADRCVLNAAQKAANIKLVVDLVVDGVVLTVTIVSGVGVVAVMVAGVSTFGVTLGGEALNRFMETQPNAYAKEFVEKALKCEISANNKIENNTCSVKQTTCAKGVLKEFFGTMNFILDGISTEQAEYVTDVVGSLSNCVSENDGDKIVQEADIKTELKTAQAASILLMAVGFANPNGATKFTLFSRFPKIMKWIGKLNDTRLSRFKIGKNLYKIQLDNTITADKLNSYIKEMEVHGYSGVVLHDAKTGKQYWQVFVKGSQDEFNMLKYRASENFDKYLDEFLKTGKSKGLPVERLSPEEWTQLNKQLLKQDVQLRETWSEGKQVMVFEKIGEIPVWNVGGVLIKNLENAGIHPYMIKDNFFEVSYRTGRQCQTGLKFHVSVNIEDLQEASFIVDDLVRNGNVADLWKVGTNGMGGSQLGKDFTIYVSQDGYDINKIQGFLNELESRLKSKNIRPNGYGSHVRTGDKPVVGSDYINYRYDRTNASGVPDGVYNGSYVFVAPKAEYGGDIMTGVRDISGSGGGTNVHIPDGTGAGTAGTGAGDIGTGGTGKSKMGRVIPVGTAAAGVYIASKIIGGGKDDDVTTDPNTDVGTPSDVVDFNESDVSPDGKINIRTDDNSTSSWSGTDDNSISSGSGNDDGPSIGGNTDVDNSSGHSVKDSLDVMMNILGGN